MTTHSHSVVRAPVGGESDLVLRARAGQLVQRASFAIEGRADEALGADLGHTRELASDLRDAATVLSKAAALLEFSAGGPTATFADYVLVATVIETAEERRVSYLDACACHSVDVDEFRRARGAVVRSSAHAEATDTLAAAAGVRREVG